MSTYWNISNESKREWLDPDRVNDCLRFPINATPKLLMLLLTGRWMGDSVQSNHDGGDHYSEVECNYVDVTAMAVKEWNERYPDDSIRYVVFNGEAAESIIVREKLPKQLT